MSTPLARKLRARPVWLPHGASEHLDLRNDRFWAGRKRFGTLSEALPAAGIAFTRASQASRYNASGRLEYLSADQPRLAFHPTLLTPLGLRIEGAMTPIVSTFLDAFDNATWSKTNTSVTANSDAAPDGTTTADRRVPSNGSTSNQIARALSGQTNGQRTVLSYFVKYVDTPWIAIGWYYSLLRLAWFNVQAGVAGGVSNGPSSRIDRAGSGYWRCQAMLTVATTAPQILLNVVSANNSNNFTGDGTKSQIAWGAQYEAATQGDFATSYNAGVARAADSLKRSVQAPGPVCRVIAFQSAPGLPASAQVIWQMDDATEANRVRLVRDPVGDVRLIVTSASSETVNLNLGNVDNDSFNRVAIHASGAEFRASLDAGTVQHASAAIPAVTTERFGSGATAGDELNGYIAEISSYDSLADGGLIEKSRVFPRWLPTDTLNRPATLFVDLLNGRFYYAGTEYSTLAALQAVLGATVTSATDWSFPWTDASVTLMYEAYAGSSGGVNRELLHIDGGADTSRICIRKGSAANLGAQVVQTGTTWMSADTETIVTGQTFRVAAGFGTNAGVISQDGKAATVDTTVNLPTVTTFRVGNSAAGTSPANDEVWKFAMWANPLGATDVQAISNGHPIAWGEGDSYMGGAGGVSVMESIARTQKRFVINLGVGGTTLAAQDTRVATEIASYPGVPFIHWDGDPNGYDADIAVDMAHYASIVAALGHSKYVIVGPLARSGQTSGQRQRARDLTTALLAAYPGHVVDALPILIALGDPITDAADLAANVCPGSLLQDTVHLVRSAMDAVLTSGVMPILSAWIAPE